MSERLLRRGHNNPFTVVALDALWPRGATAAPYGTSPRGYTPAGSIKTPCVSPAFDRCSGPPPPSARRPRRLAPRGLWAHSPRRRGRPAAATTPQRARTAAAGGVRAGVAAAARPPLADPPPPPAAAAHPAKPPDLMVRLIGTIVAGDGPAGVFLVGLASVEVKAVGDKAGGAEILRIDENNATLPTTARRSSSSARSTPSTPTAAAPSPPPPARTAPGEHGSTRSGTTRGDRPGRLEQTSQAVNRPGEHDSLNPRPPRNRPTTPMDETAIPHLYTPATRPPTPRAPVPPAPVSAVPLHTFPRHRSGRAAAGTPRGPRATGDRRWSSPCRPARACGRPIRSHDLPAKDSAAGDALPAGRKSAAVGRRHRRRTSSPPPRGRWASVPPGALAPLVEALEASGVPVAAVCPTSLPRAATPIRFRGTRGRRAKDARSDAYDAVFFPAGGQIELIPLERGSAARLGSPFPTTRRTLRCT